MVNSPCAITQRVLESSHSPKIVRRQFPIRGKTLITVMVVVFKGWTLLDWEPSKVPADKNFQ